MKRRRSSFRNIVAAAALVGICLPLDAQTGSVDSVWSSFMAQGQSATGFHDTAAAEAAYRKALREAERFGPTDKRIVLSLRSLGSVLQAVHKLAEAEEGYRRAISIVEKGNVDDSRDYADLQLDLGRVLVEQDNASAALPFLTKGLMMFSKQAGGSSVAAADAHCVLGDAYRQLRSWPEAERSLMRCAEIREADGGVMNAGLGDAVYKLALVYEQEGKLELADSRFRFAEKVREKTGGIMSPGLAEVLESHSAMLKRTGKFKESAQDEALAAAIRRHQKK